MTKINVWRRIVNIVPMWMEAKDVWSVRKIMLYSLPKILISAFWKHKITKTVGFFKRTIKISAQFVTWIIISMLENVL